MKPWQIIDQTKKKNWIPHPSLDGIENTSHATALQF
jgi:hypothetical protein